MGYLEYMDPRARRVLLNGEQKRRSAESPLIDIAAEEILLKVLGVMRTTDAFLIENRWLDNQYVATELLGDVSRQIYGSLSGEMQQRARIRAVCLHEEISDGLCESMARRSEPYLREMIDIAKKVVKNDKLIGERYEQEKDRNVTQGIFQAIVISICTNDRESCDNLIAEMCTEGFLCGKIDDVARLFEPVDDATNDFVAGFSGSINLYQFSRWVVNQVMGLLGVATKAYEKEGVDVLTLLVTKLFFDDRLIQANKNSYWELEKQKIDSGR